MTDQTPVPVDSGDLFEIDESAVEPGKTTNFVGASDDVEFDENQSTEANPGLYPDEDEQGALPDGLQVLHQEGDTTLIGHPEGVRLYGYDEPDGAE